MTSFAYVDTSALAKWYINEAGSDTFEAFLISQEAVDISRLAVLELRCLVSRRRRAGTLDHATEQRVIRTFEGDIASGLLNVHPLEDRHVVTAVGILTKLRQHPLRTIDAIHLGIAVELYAERIATADRVMADAAADLSIEAVRFH